MTNKKITEATQKASFESTDSLPVGKAGDTTIYRVLGSTLFDSLPAATQVAPGVVRLATDSEAAAGSAADCALTPANLGALTASTEHLGLVELATDAETQAQSDATRAVTPAGLASLTATESRAGLVKFATDSEVQTGTETLKAITPAGLANNKATTSRAGLVELATSTEVQAGTDNERGVTPAGLSARTATTSRTGLVELATAAETAAASDTGRAVTPASLVSGVSAKMLAEGWCYIGALDVATPTAAKIHGKFTTAFGRTPATGDLCVFAGNDAKLYMGVWDDSSGKWYCYKMTDGAFASYA